MSSNKLANEIEKESSGISTSKQQDTSVPPGNVAAVSLPNDATSSAGYGTGQNTSDMVELLKRLVNNTSHELNQINTKLLSLRGKLREMRVTAAEELMELTLLLKPRQRESLAEVYQETSSSASALAEPNCQVSEQLQSLHNKWEDMLSSLKRKKEESIEMVHSEECSGKEGQPACEPSNEEQSKQVENVTTKDDSSSGCDIELDVHVETNSNTNFAVADSDSSSAGKSFVNRMDGGANDEEALKAIDNAQTLENCTQAQSTESVVVEGTYELPQHDTCSQITSPELNIPHVVPVSDPNNNSVVRSSVAELLATNDEEAFCKTDPKDIPIHGPQSFTTNAPEPAAELPIKFRETMSETSCPVENNHVLKLSDTVGFPNLSVDLTTTQGDLATNLVLASESNSCEPQIETTINSNTFQDSVQTIGREEHGCELVCDDGLHLQDQRSTKDLIALGTSGGMQSEHHQPLDFPNDGCKPRMESTPNETYVEEGSAQILLASEKKISYHSPQKVAEPRETISTTFMDDVTLDFDSSTKKNSEQLTSASLEVACVGGNDTCIAATSCADSTQFFSLVTSPLKLCSSDRKGIEGELVHNKGVTESEMNLSEHLPLTNKAASRGIESLEHSATLPLCVSERQAEPVQSMDVDELMSL